MTHLQWAQLVMAVATLLLAILGVSIAALQWKLSSHKLKMDLFDKRYQVYLSTKQFIAHVASNQKVDFKEIINFGRSTAQEVFLFDKEVADYLNQIDKKAVELLKVQSEYEHASEADKDTLSKSEQVALKWFFNQSTEINQYFGKALDVIPPQGLAEMKRF